MNDHGVTDDLASRPGRIRDTASIALIAVGVLGVVGVTFTMSAQAGFIVAFAIIATVGVALGWSE